MTTTAKHQILIVGGGTAGITVAARLLRWGYTDVAVIEPSNTHYYQPLWTLVGAGQAKASTSMLPYDLLHAVPRQSAPDWIKSSPLSTGDADGYVDINKHTMQHMRYPNVFSLGDAGSSPNSKTGAAIRKQAPVVVHNIDAFLKKQPLPASYNGYSSCPIVTSSHEMLLAEFDYDLQLKPTFPLLDPTKPHRAYWYLKKYGLPFKYWNLMLKGLA
jgi:sulfide:quinone oxidoreductase